MQVNHVNHRRMGGCRTTATIPAGKLSTGINRRKRIMLLLTTALLHVSFSVMAQVVTIKTAGAPLEQVFTDLEKQTGYTVVANYDIIRKARPVTVTAQQMPLESFLSAVLKDQGLDYFIRSKTVTITRKTADKQPAADVTAIQTNPAVTGVVTDSTGTPLPGATIAIQGKPGFAPTDGSGRFSIKAVPGETLLVTFLGYQPVLVKVMPGQQDLHVIMKPVVAQLGEYVVEVSTGYQKLKKTQLTGAFTVIDRKTYLQSVPVTGNIIENMEGRMAGLVLNMNQTGVTDPSNASPFTIRGVSTFQAVKKPLIVLNGYPTEINIESLNPYDIESITVLKDAAAAAIYGVRASNGVVVINTRKGLDSKPQFHLTAAMTVKPKPDYRKLGLLTGKGYVDFEIASAFNSMKRGELSKEALDAANGTYTPVFSIADDLYNGHITQQEADKLLAPYEQYDNTDDYKRLFLQNQQLRTIDFSFNGGNRNATYFLGVNRVDNQRGEKFSAFDKTSINYRGAFDFMKIFTLDVQSIFSTLNDKRVPIPEYTSFRPYQHFLDDAGNPLPAYLSPYNDSYYGFDGQYGTISPERNAENMKMGLYDTYYYPYQEMFESSTHLKQNIYRLQGNLRAKVMPGLQLELGGVFERQQGTLTDWASENANQTRLMLNYYAARDPYTDKPLFRFPQGGVNKTTESLINTYTVRGQATYNKLLNDKHDLSFLAGGEVRRLTTSSRLSTVFGYDGNTLSMKPVDLSLIGNREVSPEYKDVLIPVDYGYLDDYTMFRDFFRETYQDDRFISGYANGGYTYDERYSITGSLRIDQSNLFGTDPRFRYTPLWSAGFSWNLHREQFMAVHTWIDELKMRLSAGYNGNIIKLSGPYTILGAAINNLTPNTLVGYGIKTLRNNQLRWEKTLNYNAGLDFGFWQRRVYGSIDYYIKKGTDIFSSLGIDATKGMSNAALNNASIINKGLDININTVNISGKKFKWQTQVTGSFNQSKVLNVANQFTGFYDFTRVGYPENVVGYPISAVFAHNYLGLNKNGQPIVRGEDGKPLVLSFGPRVDVPFSSLKYMGVNDPRYVLGLNNRFDFGDVNLSFLIMYYGGNVARVKPPSIFGDRPLEGIQNYWKQPGDEQHTMIPGLPVEYGEPGYYTVRTGYDYAQQFFRKMDFLVLRNVTLGWDVNEKLAKKAGLLNPRLVFQVQNPFKYVFSGNDIDPETLNYLSGTRGLPVVPAYTLSLNVNF
ncbi:SusC/RagA family TonB-linked outer membrane protein [Chitinophaga flava]|uniref:TonB-dependent receptor plug domain-containing protein n=1 Tax=Chitinophaga flava TaxID=2259036 RepID=A0A365XTS9_9BACT|nr:SusC/RagA family TonB-linked outer membrane protein [Chitinophaga flava]RBL89528.1 hypothetical protein DF182_23745 [Chitinophaga flava]